MFARFLTLQLGLLALAAFPVSAQNPPSGLAKATFAAGCFWCAEEAMDKVPGVVSTTSGYIGGSRKNPTYQEVSAGGTGHTEAVQVVYDPKKVSYEKLLHQFWLNHDPTVLNRQFCDGGSQYRPSIFWHDEEQKRLAEASKAKWEKEKPFKERIVTPIVKAVEFWPAEEYHQEYYKKNPIRYRFYVNGCGRYARLDELWGNLRKH
jgi:peptide-methionine (S)-S-oxide reductase